MTESTNDRAEILELRARLTVTERVAWFGLEIAALLRPGQTLDFLEREQRDLAAAYAKGETLEPPLSDAERSSLAAEVDKRFVLLTQEVRRLARID